MQNTVVKVTSVGPAMRHQVSRARWRNPVPECDKMYWGSAITDPGQEIRQPFDKTSNSSELVEIAIPPAHLPKLHRNKTNVRVWHWD